jgi:hypothetical protein
MRGIRLRELLLIVALVALTLGWGLDRTRLAAELEFVRSLAAQAVARHRAIAAKLGTLEPLLRAEVTRRQRAEAALAECEGRPDE